MLHGNSFDPGKMSKVTLVVALPALPAPPTSDAVPGPFSQSMAAGSNRNTSTLATREWQPGGITLARQHLWLAIHASSCTRRIKQAHDSGQTLPSCLIPSCTTMRHLVLHVLACPLRGPADRCTERKCRYIRRLIDHWRLCQLMRPECEVCSLVRAELERDKDKTRRAQALDQIRTQHGRELIRVGATDWRFHLPRETRKDTILKAAKRIYSACRSLRGYPRPCYPQILHFIQRVETRIYSSARSLPEYDHTLSARMTQFLSYINDRRAAAPRALALMPPPASLSSVFTPVLDALVADPESLAFRQPVDPLALGLDDYYDIVARPMDLQTIRTKLEQGAYGVDAWLFVEDVWLMLDNAWLYNKKASRVYKNCNRLAELFKEKIPAAMNSLGYCCGERYVFQLPPVEGQGQQGKGNKKMQSEPEPFVKCGSCGRRMHQICELYVGDDGGKAFQCTTCRHSSKPAPPFHRARHLPETVLGTLIEARINRFLRSIAEAGAQSLDRVWIRVVSSTNKRAHLLPLAAARFTPGSLMQPFYPYRAKVILAFQQQDGVDVCFFCMHVQEYGSECPAPNTRRVYIAYLDSAHFFQPKAARTGVYHQILLGYLEYAKEAGFHGAHIWACPPGAGEDYIFYRHPPEQKTPAQARLRDWYRAMLEKGVEEGIVVNFQSSIQDIVEKATASPEQVPYFEGDLWPKMLEAAIKDLEEAEQLPGKKARMSTTTTPKSGRNGRYSKKQPAPRSPPSLATKIRTWLREKNANEVFFVVRLNNISGPDAQATPTIDPDPVRPFYFIDGRDTFLGLQLERRWEFSSLRRAMWSTASIVKELLTTTKPGARPAEITEGYDYSCDICNWRLHAEGEVLTSEPGSPPPRKRYHCTICEDFDLCPECLEKGHEHPMELVRVNKPKSPQPNQPVQQQPGTARNESLDSFDAKFLHGSTCTDPACSLQACVTIKRLKGHIKQCQLGASGCTNCSRFHKICLQHAQHCRRGQDCKGLGCRQLKEKMAMARAARAQAQATLSQRPAKRSLNPTPTTTASALQGIPPELRQYVMSLGDPKHTDHDRARLALAAIRSSPRITVQLLLGGEAGRQQIKAIRRACRASNGRAQPQQQQQQHA